MAKIIDLRRWCLWFLMSFLGAASQLYAATAVADNGGSMVSNGGTLSVSVLSNDTVTGTYNVTAQLVQGQGTVGVTLDPGAGNGATAGTTVDFTPTPGFAGTVVINYTADDFQGPSTAAITITVAAPIPFQAVDDTATSLITNGTGAPVTINVLANDSYDPQFPPTVSLSPTITPANAGTAIVDQQNQIVFTPAANFTGAVALSYSMSNVQDQSASANITVNVQQNPSLVNSLLTPEELRAAQVLDIACETATGALASSCAVLQRLSAQDQQKAIEQILPNQVPAQLQGIFLQQDQQLSLLRHRLGALRAGAHGVNVSGLNVRLQDNNMALGQALQSEIDGNGSAGDTTAFADTPWGLFVSGRINHGKIDTRDTQKGFDFRQDILAAGIDYRKSDRLVLGSALGYSATNNDLSSNSGNLDLKSWMLSFYGNYYPRENVYVDWIVGYSHNAYDGKRHLQLGSIDDHAKFNSDGKQYSANVTTGYDWNLKAWQLGSYVRADYIHSMIDGYTESDTAGLALQVAEQQARSVETALGARTTYSWSYSKGVLIPGLDVEYVHQWQQDQRFITVALADSPSSGTFGIHTRPLDANYFNVGLSLTSVYTGGKSAFIRFETITGRQSVRENTAEAGFRMEF